MELVADFLAAGLAARDSGIVIATEDHRSALERRLESRGFQVERLRAEGRYVPLEAAETLARFMTGDVPDRGKFFDCLQPLVSQAARQAESSGGQLRAFGEMVALLHAGGLTEAAIQLEHLWNELQARHAFLLLCAYPLRDFDREEDALAIQRICGAHTHSVPAESYAGIVDDGGRDRTVIELQQKAATLERELRERRRLEAELKEKLEILVTIDAQKTSFMKRLAHELRNPLSPIRNSIEIMKLVHDRPDLLLRCRDIIERNTNLLVRNVDDLLCMLYPGHGAPGADGEPAELSAAGAPARRAEPAPS